MVAKLIVASGKSAGRSITLKHGKILIGRAEECDIRPLGEEVSRRHCAVVEEAGAVTVEDLKSRNGTYVNGAKIAAKMSAVLLPREAAAPTGWRADAAVATKGPTLRCSGR